jgi:hypothetical protein
MSATQKELLEFELTVAKRRLVHAHQCLHFAEEEVAEAQCRCDDIIGELQELEHEEAEA